MPCDLDAESRPSLYLYLTIHSPTSTNTKSPKYLDLYKVYLSARPGIFSTSSTHIVSPPSCRRQLAAVSCGTLKYVAILDIPVAILFDPHLAGFALSLTVLRSLTNSTLQRMQTDPPAGVSASPIPDNVMTWYEAAVMSWTG